METYTQPKEIIPIEINGKILKTIFWDGNVKTDLVKQIRDEYFSYPSFDNVKKQLYDVIINNKNTTNDIFKYYFDDIAIKTKGGIKAKFTFEEFINNDILVTTFINKVLAKPEFFNTKGDVPLIKQFMAAVRLGGSSTVWRAQNFPLNKARKIITEEYTGKNYLDTSAGWGNRMLLAASKGMNYYAFEVNHELVIKLNELGSDIKKYILPNFNFKIYETGSQNHIDELDGKMDLLFTSPPFFILEEYNLPDEYDISKYENNYEKWVNDFLAPTIKNISLYLKENSKSFINFKNFKKGGTYYDIVSDTLDIMSDNDFKNISVSEFKPGKRFSSRVSNFDKEAIIFGSK